MPLIDPENPDPRLMDDNEPPPDLNERSPEGWYCDHNAYIPFAYPDSDLSLAPLPEKIEYCERCYRREVIHLLNALVVAIC